MAAEYPTTRIPVSDATLQWGMTFPNYIEARIAMESKPQAYLLAENLVICHLAQALKVDRDVIDGWLAGGLSE